MTGPIERIAVQGAGVQEGLLALNNAHQVETSFLTRQAWDHMIAQAFAATCFERTAGLLIVFDQTADYDSPNYLWFRERLDRFVYVDRIIVGGEHRGRGIAKALYEDLFARALAAGHDRVVCEVNFDPPNPGSDAFHDRLGFSELGRARVDGRDKTVRYLERALAGANVPRGD